MAANLGSDVYQQIIDSLSQGTFVLDREMRVVLWNRWMEQHSGLSRNQVIGQNIGTLFPDLNKKAFSWKVKNVFNLGNFAFFSQELHSCLFSFSAASFLNNSFETMQQSVVVAPIRNQEGQVDMACVSISDVTDAVISRERLKASKQRLEELSRIDHLTEVANRRHFMEHLVQEINRHQRQDLPLSLAILDIDHFKKVNDNHGHLCGDKALVDFAKLVSASLRKYDMIGRYGGEEFCLLLPATNLETAIAVLERIRASLAETVFQWEDVSFRLTASMGVVSTQDHPGFSIDSLMRLADEALYQAKASGRDRVVAA
jgi:diguanylate cyclase (GGDEF)-like protein